MLDSKERGIDFYQKRGYTHGERVDQERTFESVFQEPVGEFRRRPEDEQFFRLAKTAKQAMLVLSSMQPAAARWTTAAALIRPLLRQQQIKRFKKKGRSKPDRVFRHSIMSAPSPCP